MKKNYFQLLTLLVLFISVLSQQSFGQKERAEIDDKYKWDLTPIFQNDEAWYTAKDKLAVELEKVESFKGMLTKSSDQLLACMEYLTQIQKDFSKLSTYAGMNSDLDLRDMKYSGMEKELEQLISDANAKSAYMNPEILAAGWEVIEGFIKEEPKLEVYRKGLVDLYRGQEHTLSEPEERIMALSGLITGSPYSIFSTYSNAEMPAPEITLSTGEKAILNSAGYSKYRASSNRADRELVFKTYWNHYKDYQATFGEILYGNVKSDIFYAKARNYESSLEAALFGNDIPVDVYYSLIENVNKSLPVFHRYLEIKKRMMGLDTLKYLDLYASAVKDVDLSYTYDESKDLILKSLAPLGDEYTSTVKKAFDERWIDVYPTKGKRSGAYSNGSAYGVHPYILLNYNGMYDDVSTISHELGHTMHSYYSNKTQPYPLADYSIFVAEVASTFNEALLFNHMMGTVKDDDVKLSLLMEYLDGFKGTLFRQTQFAEYELRIHEAAEQGKPLTGEFLSELYLDIVRKYYGHDKGVCYVDDYINMEWAFIPHFYYNFYVYQYSTSFTASASLSEQVLNKEKGAVEKYMNFISAGGSDYPIEVLKKAGVDMTTSEPFEKAMEAMNAAMDEIEKILDKKK